MSGGVIKTWDLDVERMSRDDLEANYFDAVAIIEDLQDTDAPDFVALQRLFKEMKSCSPGLSARFTYELMKGGVKTHNRLAILISPVGLDGSVNEGQKTPRIVSVAACIARSSLKDLGVEVSTVWGVGYEMPTASIAKLNHILAGRQSNQRGK